ncbi:hypothetical protein Tco_1220915 [Tanacetum coccineum]
MRCLDKKKENRCVICIIEKIKDQKKVDREEDKIEDKRKVKKKERDLQKRILYDDPIDEVECFDPGGNNDEIDAFLAIKVPTYIEEVFFNHEPQHNTFSPKSDPLHHEFTGELITSPPGIVREHEDYINRMSLLCGNSSSRSQENFHTIIESLPSSTTLVEDSDSNREEIDIFFGPDDSIPSGIESDFDSEEDTIDNLLNNDPIPEYESSTLIMEPNVLVISNVNEDECFDPRGGGVDIAKIARKRAKPDKHGHENG